MLLNPFMDSVLIGQGKIKPNLNSKQSKVIGSATFFKGQKIEPISFKSGHVRFEQHISKFLPTRMSMLPTHVLFFINILHIMYMYMYGIKPTKLVIVSLAQLVEKMNNICKVQGSNLGHRKKKKPNKLKRDNYTHLPWGLLKWH